jgi:zinc protease
MFRTSFPLFFLLCSFLPAFAQISPNQGRLPSVQRDVLLTDLPVIVASRPGSTSVTVSAVVKVGATFDRAGKAGLARLTAEAILSGAGGYNADRLKLELEDNQAQLDLYVDWDMTRFSITGPARNAPLFLELLGTYLSSPDLSKKTFSDDQFLPVRQNHIENLKWARTEEGKGDALFLKSLYGSHPYNHFVDGTPESVAAITRFDVAEFWKRHYMPNNAAVIIVGDVTADLVRSDARKAFGGWVKAKPAPYSFLPPAEISGTKIVFQPDEGQTSAQVRVGWFTSRYPENERLSWLILAEVLKARFPETGVAVENRHLADSPWMLSRSIEAGKVPEVVGSISRQLKDLREKPPTEAEIQSAKVKVLKRYETEAGSNFDIAMVLSVAERYGASARGDADFPQKLNGITGEQLKPALEKLGGKGLLITVRGGTASQKAALAEFGTVEVVETQATSAVVKP